MLERMLNNLRLLVVGFGFGVILAGTIHSWGLIPIQFSIFFLLSLFITLYFAVSFTFLSHDKYSHNEQNNAYTHRN